MIRHRRPRTTVVVALALALTTPAAADAAAVKLSCSGKGARTIDSSGTVQCAGSPAKGRTLAGTVRNDTGQPVAAKLAVTFSTWAPSKGGGYTVKPTSTREIVAKADGSFSIRRNPKTRETVEVDVLPDPGLGIAAAANADAEIARRLDVKVAKLGGGRVRITVRGTTVRPITVYILDSFGNAVSGVKPKKVDRGGRATFALGAQRGKFAYLVSTGIYADLFWYLGRPTFRL